MSSSVLFSAAHGDTFHDLLPMYSRDARLSVAYMIAASAIVLLLVALIGIFLLALIRSRTRKKLYDVETVTENSHISTTNSVAYDSINTSNFA